MNALAERQPPAAPAAVSETAAILSVIERAAKDPAVDIDKMERLLQMRERMVAQGARRAYLEALARLQPELPIVDRRGKIEIRSKGDDSKVIQSTPYALWEDINEAITPILSAHGFSLSFRTGIRDDGKVFVTGILGHSEGHTEETTVTLPHDSTGSKNAVQAVGSSYSYGKRYSAVALLNITSRGEDDDAETAGAPTTISEEQLKNLQAMIDETHSDIRLLCKFFGVAALADLPAARYGEASAKLQQKARKAS